MMTKWKWSMVGLVAAGLVAGLCAAVLTVVLRVESQNRDQPAESPEVSYVCAARPLPALTVIDGGVVATKTVPRQNLPEGVLAAPALVLGKVLAVPLVEGQPFLKSSFVADGAGPQLAATIPAGQRAVTLSLPDDGSMKGLLYPGCLVDVVGSFDVPAERAAGGRAVVSTVLVQGVQVLAVEDRTVLAPEGGKSADGSGLVSVPAGRTERRLVTLLADLTQARALRLALQHGTVSLVMRNPVDRQAPAAGQTFISDLVASTALGTAQAQVALPPSPTLAVVGVCGPGAAATVAGETPAVRLTPPVLRWEVQVLRAGAHETQTFDLPAAQEARVSERDVQ